MAQPREQWLDVMRGFAASAVIFQHSLELGANFHLWTMRYFNFGQFGVTLFFLASGYIIPSSLERGGLGAFWCSRFFRLYPLYWLSIAATVLLATAPLASSQILFNLTMVQEWFGHPHLQEVYWTLSTEMAFYMAVSALYLTPFYSRLDKRLPLLVLLGALLVLSLASLMTHLSLPLGRLVSFVSLFAGVALAQHRHSPERGQLTLAWKIAIPLVLALTAFVKFPAGASLAWTDTSIFSNLCAFLSWGGAYLVFALFMASTRQGWPSMLLRLGSACYGMYILHPLVLQNFGWASYSWPFRLAGVWTLATLLAFVSWNFLEHPLIRLGKSLSRRSGAA